MHELEWEKAKYHEFEEIPADSDFQTVWYKRPFLYDIVIESEDDPNEKYHFKKNFFDIQVNKTGMPSVTRCFKLI